MTHIKVNYIELYVKIKSYIELDPCIEFEPSNSSTFQAFLIKQIKKERWVHSCLEIGIMLQILVFI